MGSSTVCQNPKSQYRAHGHYTLGGIPSLKAGTQPPSCIYLDNRLYMSIAKNGKALFLKNGTNRIFNV